MLTTVAIFGGLALVGIGYRVFRWYRLSPRDRWLRRYDERLKRNHPFFI
ncbi:MAG: hypothetical protein OHK005_05590 [Candidatus Methylacidiphilales bacterium]